MWFLPMVSPLWAIASSFVKQISKQKHRDLDPVMTILTTAHLFSDFFFSVCLVLFFLGSPSFHLRDALCSFQSPHGTVGVCLLPSLLQQQFTDTHNSCGWLEGAHKPRSSDFSSWFVCFYQMGVTLKENLLAVLGVHCCTWAFSS